MQEQYLLEYVKTLNAEKLSNYILSLSDDIKSIILRDESFRNHILTDNNHYAFVWLVQGLKNDEISYLLDNSMIDKILQDNRKIDKLNAIFTCGNPNVGRLIKDDRVMKLIVSSNLSDYISQLDSLFAQNLFNYVTVNAVDKLNIFGRLNERVAYELLSDEKNLKKLEALNTKDMLLTLDNKTVTMLLTKQKYILELLSMDINSINGIIIKGIELPRELQENSILMQKYLDIYNISKYRMGINNLSNNNSSLTDLIEKRRAKQYDNFINNINENGMIDRGLLKNKDVLNDFKMFKNYNGDKLNESIMIEYTDKIMLEVLVDKYFKDITYNFLKNTIEMLNYISLIKEEIIPIERLEIYKNIINFYNLGIEERKKLYFSLNNIPNLISDYYDDYVNCKKHSIELINKKSIKPDNMLINDYLTNQSGVNTYELKGQDFYAIVHNTGIDKNSNNKNYWRDSMETISLSLISDNHIKTFHDKEDYIIFGYNHIDNDRVMHIYHTDSYSSKSFGTNYIYEIDSPENLINKTESYNEILYQEINVASNDYEKAKEDYKPLKPDYVMCYDYIKEEDIKCAKNLNIPIVLMHTKYYQYDNNNVYKNDEDKYNDYYTNNSITYKSIK